MKHAPALALAAACATPGGAGARRHSPDRTSSPSLAALAEAARGAETQAAAGQLELRATVGPSGAASLVEILDATVHDPDVRACVYWNLRDAGYPQNKPGRFTSVFAFRR